MAEIVVSVFGPGRARQGEPAYVLAEGPDQVADLLRKALRHES
jgi:hypothetical protein